VRCKIDGWPGDAGRGAPAWRGADSRDERSSASTRLGLSGGRTRPAANFAMHSKSPMRA